MGPSTTVDIDHRVDLGGTGLRREGVEVLTPGIQVLGQFLELEGALVERQLAQFRLAGGPAVIHDGGQVQAVRAHPGQHFAGARIPHGDSGSGGIGVGRPPRIPHETGNGLDGIHRGFSSYGGGHR
jgi:hypothetical protein